MTTAPPKPTRSPSRPLRGLRTIIRATVLLIFIGAVYLSGRLGVEMARNRLPGSENSAAGGASEAITLGDSGDPLYLARSPEELRRFFAAHPSPEDRAAANLSGSGIRRLQDSMQLTTLRAEADAVEVEVNSGAIAGAVYWIHHSQLPSASTFDPIIPPVPVPPLNESR